MNKATHVIQATINTLNNPQGGDHEKCTALTITYNALCDIYGRDTASAVLWAIAETCHVTGTKFSPVVTECIRELTA